MTTTDLRGYFDELQAFTLHAGERILPRDEAMALLLDPVTPTDTDDPIPPDEEDEEIGTGARMDPHGDEPQDDPLPEGVDDDEDDEA